MRLAERPRETAIMLDVDGTLAPIVARPEDAVVPDATRGLVEQLAARYGLVAAISGRPGEDLGEMVGVEGVAYVGEHGLELDPRAAEWAPAIAEFAESVDWPAELKRLSVSFHFRTAEDEQAAEGVEIGGVVPRVQRPSQVSLLQQCTHGRALVRIDRRD